MNEFLIELKQVYDQLLQGDEGAMKWITTSKTIRSLVRIPGDASARKYYRILGAPGSFIVMKMEPFPDQKDTMPFLVVAKHLLQVGVDVPGIFDVDSERGFILLEDLGDVTLLRKLQEISTSDSERHLYEKIIDSLVTLQVHASPQLGDLSIEAFQLRFDYEKLMWEVQFTIDNFYRTYLKRSLSDRDFGSIYDGFSEICKYLSEQPTVLTHRDFHSRNVMVVSGNVTTEQRLVMIDFQDARMGPPQYDLASLLRDSYYQLEDSQIALLIDYYIARYEATSGLQIDRQNFIRIFDMMSVQRNFKAIGSFASFMNRRGDPTYLKYIGNTFENIRRVLLKYPHYSNLRESLFHNYYF